MEAFMATVIAKPNESIDSLLRRFKKAVERSGVLSEVRKREYYEKPSVQKKRKQAAARKRALKRERILVKRSKGKNVNFKYSRDRSTKIYINPPKRDAVDQSGVTPRNSNYKGKNYKSDYKKNNSFVQKTYSENQPRSNDSRPITPNPTGQKK